MRFKANHMGGYGNQPLNIFPQNSTINQVHIINMKVKFTIVYYNASYGFLTWDFYYETSENTQPNKVIYSAKFVDSICEPLYEEFTN